eukprot:UN00348
MNVFPNRSSRSIQTKIKILKANNWNIPDTKTKPIISNAKIITREKENIVDVGPASADIEPKQSYNEAAFNERIDIKTAANINESKARTKQPLKIDLSEESFINYLSKYPKGIGIPQLRQQFKDVVFPKNDIT